MFISENSVLATTMFSCRTRWPEETFMATVLYNSYQEYSISPMFRDLNRVLPLPFYHVYHNYFHSFSPLTICSYKAKIYGKKQQQQQPTNKQTNKQTNKKNTPTKRTLQCSLLAFTYNSIFSFHYLCFLYKQWIWYLLS